MAVQPIPKGYHRVNMHLTFKDTMKAIDFYRKAFGFEQGMAFANRIHASGRAVVWSGHREPAELYWEGLKGLGLTMAPLER